MRFASSLSRQLLPCSHDLQAPFASAAAHRSGPSVESIAKNSTTQARYALFQKPDGRNWPAGCFLFSKASSNTPLAPPLARFHPQFRSRGSNKIIVSYLRATPHHDQSLHQAARTAASNWFFFLLRRRRCFDAFNCLSFLCRSRAPLCSSKYNELTEEKLL